VFDLVFYVPLSLIMRLNLVVELGWFAVHVILSVHLGDDLSCLHALLLAELLVEPPSQNVAAFVESLQLRFAHVCLLLLHNLFGLLQTVHKLCHLF
jgi:hypothetical protein